MPDLYIIARILHPHGRRGDVVVRSLTDHIETLMGAASVYLGLDSDTPVTVQKIRLHKGSPLLKLEGIEDINGALELKGVDICLPREELAPLEEGEYFLHDLVGFTVLDSNGAEVGPVDGFVETGGPPLLGGKRGSGKQFLIPFAPGTIDDVDLEAGTIRLADLPGLIDE
ncbi:MAG: ribosome maturation factor RimM [bacterium]|nr:ribosome maturation factor RimM [bacterium]